MSPANTRTRRADTLTTYADGMTCLRCGGMVPWRDLLALLENDPDSAGGQGVDPI